MDGIHPPLALQIDELVIHGLPHVDRAQLGSIVQQELTRLFAERGIPPALQQNRAIATIDGGAITVQPGTSTATVGSQIARAVYGGFST